MGNLIFTYSEASGIMGFRRLCVMPTVKPRFTITMDETLFQQIEEYRFKHRYKNQTQAVISLIEQGLDDLLERQNEQGAPDVLTPDGRQLIDDCRSMNDEGKEYLRHTVYMAKQIHKKMPDLPSVERQA